MCYSRAKAYIKEIVEIYAYHQNFIIHLAVNFTLLVHWMYPALIELSWVVLQIAVHTWTVHLMQEWSLENSLHCALT